MASEWDGFLEVIARDCFEVSSDDEGSIGQVVAVLRARLLPLLETGDKMAEILAGDLDCRWDDEWRAAREAALKGLRKQ